MNIKMTSKGKGVKDHEGVSQTGRMSDAKKQLLKAGWKKKSVEESLYEKSFTPKMVKMAIGIASDDRYAGNNMTGATKAIEKIAKGLSGHPQVQAVLKKQNESVDLDEAKSQGMFVVLEKGSKNKVIGQFKDKSKAVDMMKKNAGSKVIQIGKFATDDDKPVDIKVGDELSYTRVKLATKVKESVDLDEGIVSKTLTGLVDKGLNKVLDKLEKMTGKHLGFVQKSNIPSAGTDRGNEYVKFKKEAEDFHRKAKKQWTYSKREVGDSFKYYGTGKIPQMQIDMVNDLQAEMQKIIDMHTQLEKMMQTTGNSAKYQRTMEKLDFDTSRVFKEIAKVTEKGDARYRAMQGMGNLAKAKKMTHKTPGQINPVKFRAYGNMGESVELDEKGPKIGVDRLKQQRDADSKIDIKGAKKRKPRVSSTKKNLSSISARADKKAMESFDLVSEASLIPALRDIADNKSATKVKGTLVDMFTASMITQIYDKVNDANKTKMDKLPLEKLVNIAHKIMKKEDAMVQTEAKSDYTIMHKSYSDAMSHAYDVAKKRGYEVDMDDVSDKVAMGPRKPSEGKTNSHNLTITKGGKPVKKQLNVQVYNRGGNTPFELNMYIESVDLDEGIVSKTLTGLVDKGLHKVLDQIEKKTGKHLGFVKKSTVPSAGKDRGNEFVKFKKEAEDFHRKAKKQWTWSSKEIEAGFQYYGSGKIPDDKVKLVKRVQADIQKIIAMHTKLESMMQTTGNSPTYQRTMEKLESDTKRVFKEIDDGGIGAIGGKYRAMQGMDNLKKAKKMTHKEPRQISPTKFRAYANMGESLTAEERKFVESLNNMSEGDYGKKKIKTEGGYGKINATYGKKAKEEELSPKQKKIDKNKNGKIDGSDLASLRKEEVLNELGNKYVMDTGDLAKVQKALNAMGASAPKIVKDKAGYFHIKFQSKVGNTGSSTSSGHKGPYQTMAAVLDGLMKMQKESTEISPLDRMLQPSMHQQTLEINEKKDDYEDHMMYDSKTGKGRMTTSYEDHLALKDKGWGHEKPTNESYGKMNASKMSSKEKAKARALAKADKDAQPKDKVSLKKAPWEKKNESVDIDERKLTWKDWERQGNDAWMSREKRKDNPYKKKGQARTSWFDGWDNMQMDSDAGDIDESYVVEASMENAAAELEAYAKKNGGMDKNTFMRVANLLKTGHPDKLKSYVDNMDTDPRDYVAMLLKKHIGKKPAERMLGIRFFGESISAEDAATLRAAGVKLVEISSDMKKRYNKAALKDRDQQKNTLKRADDVSSKVVDGAVTDKASPSQTNSRFAKLDKIKQKANRKLTNRRKGLATPGKGSTTKVKDYFGMAEDVEHLIEASDKQDAKEMSEIVREMNPKYTDAQVAKEVEKMAMEKYDNKQRAKKIAAHI